MNGSETMNAKDLYARLIETTYALLGLRFRDKERLEKEKKTSDIEYLAILNEIRILESYLGQLKLFSDL